MDRNAQLVIENTSGGGPGKLPSVKNVKGIRKKEEEGEVFGEPKGPVFPAITEIPQPSLADYSSPWPDPSWGIGSVSVGRLDDEHPAVSHWKREHWAYKQASANLQLLSKGP